MSDSLVKKTFDAVKKVFVEKASVALAWFWPSRKGVSSTSWWLRFWVRVAIIFCFLAYFIFLLVGIPSAIPLNKQQRLSTGPVPAPNILFTWDHPFEAGCGAVDLYGVLGNCTSQPEPLPNSNFPHANFYNASNSPKFSLSLSDRTGNYTVALIFIIQAVNITDVVTDLASTISFGAFFFDQNQSPTDLDGNVNSYVLGFGQAGFVSYTRWANTTLRHNSANIFGAPTIYDRFHYVTSNYMGSQPLVNQSDTAILKVTLGSEEVTEISEEPSSTFLSVCSKVGGLIPLALGVYAAFFISRPEHEKVKEYVNKYVSEHGTQRPEDSGSAVRQDALETYLQNYLIDIGYLKDEEVEHKEGKVGSFLDRIRCGPRLEKEKEEQPSGDKQ